MDTDCVCGHSGSRHHEEQPYPCYECDCRGFYRPLFQRQDAPSMEPPDGIESYLWDFICALYPEAPNLALYSFNERLVIEHATAELAALRERLAEYEGRGA